MPDADWNPPTNSNPTARPSANPGGKDRDRLLRRESQAQQSYYSYSNGSEYPPSQPHPPPYQDAYRSGMVQPGPYSQSAPQGHSESFDSSGSAAGGHMQPGPGFNYQSLPPMPAPSMRNVPAQGYVPLTVGPPSVHRSVGGYHHHPPPFYPPQPAFWGGSGSGSGAGPQPPFYPQSSYPGQNPHHPSFQYPTPPSHGLMLPPLAHPSLHRHLYRHHHHPPSGPIMPAAIVEYITEIHPQDVMSGRGGATNSHSGNRFFRTLVKEHQDEYLKAKKRDKPGVAALIVERVRKRGGRFLKRIEDPSSHRKGGDGGYAVDPGRMPLYVDIGDERALEKTCQALREGAPEIRRKKQENSSDESGTVSVHKSPFRPSSLAVALSATSTSSLSFDVNHRSPGAAGTAAVITAGSPGDSKFPGEQRRRARAGDYGEDDERFYYSDLVEEGPIMIRPAARFMPGRPPISPHPIDQLSAEDRDVYLAFLPPYPSIRTKRQKTEAAAASSLNASNAVASVSEELDGPDADGRHRVPSGASSVPSLLNIVRV